MIEKLSNAYSPSAKEEEVRDIIIKELSDFYTDIRIDNLGNLIIHKPGKKKTIAITAPMDEVNFVVTHTKNENSVIATSICDVKSNTLQNIVLKNQNGEKFIVEKTAKNTDLIEKIRNIELFEISGCKVNNLNISQSLIYSNSYNETDNFIVGKALERSVLCSILCDIARNVSNSLYEYYFIFSTQNYCDKKGSLTATYDLKIDELYNLCCIDTDREDVKINEGPVVIIRDKMLISDVELLDKFNNIERIQKLITSNFICEGGYYQRQHTTQKIISVGLAVNFLGCFNEVVSKNDINCLKSVILEKILP